ncbi:putative HTH-type transcriptional regulator YcgE [Microbispora sp. NBRC 16548]|nr:putative HTH-type transcriptional regulator YcgE [Microbispora sp. NBRC 16548]
MSSARAELMTEITNRIRRTNQRGAEMANAAARVIGVNSTDMACIQMLQYEPLTAGELARRTGLTTASVTTVIDRLEAAGFVARTRDPADRRRVVVEFQPEKAGPSIAGVFLPLLRSWRDLMTDYDERDLRVIAEFLGRVEDALDDEIHKLRER